MYLKFAINRSVLFIFTEIHMQTEIPKYETHQTPVAPPPPPPWVNLRGWTEVKKSFLEYGHVAYQVKEDCACYMVANVKP